MKLITAIVSDDDCDKLLDSLAANRYSATKIGSTGGFLRKGNATLLVGAEEERLEDLISLIRDTCRSRGELFHPPFPPVAIGVPPPIEVQVGGAVVFVQDVERFERI